MKVDLLRQLRSMVAAMPPGSSVSLPTDWLRNELESFEEQAPNAKEVSATADITVDEVAAELNRSPSTVRGWLMTGAFPRAFKLNGREWRIPRSDIAAYLDKQRPVVQQERSPARRKKDADLSSWRSHMKGTSK